VRLARKITVAIAAAILVVMAAHAYFLIHREVVLFDADLARSTNLKRALRASIEETWRAYGDGAAQRLVEETIPAAVEGVRIRWTWLDAPPGDPRHLDLPPEQLARLRAGERVIVLRDEDTRRYTYIPVAIAGSRVAVLEFVESVGEQHAFINASRVQIEIATVVILLACAAAVYALGVWYVGRPIQRLRDKLHAIAAGDYDAPLDLRQRDEIGELARDIDTMAVQLAESRRRLVAESESRMAALERLRHTDRLTTIGQLASGVAHELGTPLAVITGRAEMIVSGEAAGERAPASARVIVEQAGRMTRLIRQLLDFARQRGPRFEVVNVRAICADTVDTLAAIARRRGAILELRAAADQLLVSADEHQIQQVLANLIVNALHAMPNGGRVVVTVGPRNASPPGEPARDRAFVCVTVEDHGTGIRREDLPHVFEPFFTTKDPGEGTGLGLAVVQGIVRDHGGWVEVESEPKKGSRFVIFLPRAAEAQTPPQKAA
jgi:signal transduction histidine kinase